MTAGFLFGRDFEAVYAPDWALRYVVDMMAKHLFPTGAEGRNWWVAFFVRSRRTMKSARRGRRRNEEG
jgi:hypothetical protein